MKKTLNLKNQKGIALVEVIAAIAIAIVVITSLVSLSLSTMRASLRSKLRLEGTVKATRELELVRAYRDSPDRAWKAGFVADVIGCTMAKPCYMNNLTIVTTGSFTYKNGTPEALSTYFLVTRPDGTALQADDSIVRVTAITQWWLAGGSETSAMYTDLSNWRGK